MEVSYLTAFARSTLVPCRQVTYLSVARITCKLSLPRIISKMNTGPRRIFMIIVTPPDIQNQISHGTIDIDNHTDTAV